MKKLLRQALLVVFDIIAINAAYILAFVIRFDGQIFIGNQTEPFFETYLGNAVVLTLIKLVFFSLFRIYNSLWRYASVEEMIQVVFATVSGSVATVVYFHFSQAYLPRSIYIIALLLDLLMIGGIRFSYRSLRALRDMSWFRKEQSGKRTLIYGAGDAGAQLARELRFNSHNRGIPVGFIDDDNNKNGRLICGIPVLGNRSILKEVVKRRNVEQIILSIPSASKSQVREIVNICTHLKVELKIVPSLGDLIDGKINVSEIRNVEIDDLLSRDAVTIDIDSLSHEIHGKRIMVTGGGGSIGSEICRQVAKLQPEALMAVDIYENAAYDLEQELKRKFPELKLFVRIGSVRERTAIFEIMNGFKPHIVYHAAAHKHVPLMEDAPREAIKNNIFGTWNTMQAARKAGAEKFVQISTDKAVNPTNVMGATKRVCEMMAQAINEKSNTEYVAVRFGNVLGSNGSVIPLFKKQIAAGGPVTVTHPDIIRYFMTIPEACRLVIQAGAIARGGEIFILDMGEPVRIVDLARNLIRLSGFEPDQDIAIQYTGLRPGEKLFEELLLDTATATSTSIEKIFVEKTEVQGYREILSQLKALKRGLCLGDHEAVAALRDMVPEFVTPEEHQESGAQHRTNGA